MSAWISLFGLHCYVRQGELESLVLNPPDEETLSSFVNFHKWGVCWFSNSHRTSWHFQTFVLEIVFPSRHKRNLFLSQMNVWRFPSFLQLALEICWLIYNKIHKGRDFYAGQPLASSSHLKISCKLCNSDAVFLLLPFSEMSTGQILSIGSFPAFLRSFFIYFWEMWELGREKKPKLFKNLLKNIQILSCIPLWSFSFQGWGKTAFLHLVQFKIFAQKPEDRLYAFN